MQDEMKKTANPFQRGIAMHKKILILDSDLNAILNDPFEDIKKIEGQLYRFQSGRKTISFTTAGKLYFAKIHSGVGWKEIIKNIFQLRWPIISAKTEWNALVKLQTLGIKAPIPVAFGEQGINPARLNSFIVTNAITQTINLEDFFKAHPVIAFNDKKRLIETVANIARTLHENGINHRDFYLCHFLLDISSANPLERPLVYIIDLHRAQIRHKTPFRWRVKDISGLYFSTMDLQFTRQDYLRFIRYYTTKPLSFTLNKNRLFWWAVRLKAKRLYEKS